MQPHLGICWIGNNDVSALRSRSTNGRHPDTRRTRRDHTTRSLRPTAGTQVGSQHPDSTTSAPGSPQSELFLATRMDCPKASTQLAAMLMIARGCCRGIRDTTRPGCATHTRSRRSRRYGGFNQTTPQTPLRRHAGVTSMSSWSDGSASADGRDGRCCAIHLRPVSWMAAPVRHRPRPDRQRVHVRECKVAMAIPLLSQDQRVRSRCTIVHLLRRDWSCGATLRGLLEICAGSAFPALSRYGRIQPELGRVHASILRRDRRARRARGRRTHRSDAHVSGSTPIGNRTRADGSPKREHGWSGIRGATTVSVSGWRLAGHGSIQPGWRRWTACAVLRACASTRSRNSPALQSKRGSLRIAPVRRPLHYERISGPGLDWPCNCVRSARRDRR